MTAVIIGAVLMAACGGSDGDDDAAGGPPADAASSPTTAPTTTTEPASSSDGTVAGVAELLPAEGSGVSGKASLRWDPDSGVLEVTVELTGVDEGASYASMIAPGCGPGGGHVHALGVGVGDADGTLTHTAEVRDVETIDLDGGWAVKVARPPAGPQACGEVRPT